MCVNCFLPFFLLFRSIESKQNNASQNMTTMATAIQVQIVDSKESFDSTDSTHPTHATVQRDQLKHILDLECEIYALKDSNAKLNRKMNERNNEISRLRLENNDLKMKVQELEYSLRQKTKGKISVCYNITVILKRLKHLNTANTIH